MFFIGSNHGAQRSFEYIQGAWNSSTLNYQLLHFFTGTPPTDFSTIPLEWQTNINRMFENSVACTQVYKNARDVQEVKGNITANYVTNRTWRHPRGNVLDPIIGRWVLNDFHMTSWRSEAGIYEYRNRGIRGVDFSGTNQEQIFEQYYEFFEDLVWRDTYNQVPTGYHHSRINGSDQYSSNQNFGRSAQNYPSIITFRNPENVDSLFFRQNGASYSSATVTVEIWDDTLNSGEGDWGDSFVLTPLDGYSQQLLDFPQAYTTKRLRLTWSDTGSQNQYLEYITPCSQTEPALGKDPYDITWALVSYTGGNQSNANFYDYLRFYFNFFDTDVTHNQIHGYPFMLVDVGQPGDDATVILNKSRGVMPGDSLQVLHMGLNWRDV